MAASAGVTFASPTTRLNSSNHTAGGATTVLVEVDNGRPMTQTIIKVPAAGAFDPTDIEITDGVDDAFLIKDTSGDEWFKIDTAQVPRPMGATASPWPYIRATSFNWGTKREYSPFSTHGSESNE